MLSKGEFGRSYCGGCVGDKVKGKQDQMCIKAVCNTKCHQSNLWGFDTLLVSASGCFVFIRVKGKEDLVWTATTLPFEAIEPECKTPKKDRCPLAEWETVFDHFRGSVGLSKQVEVALQATTDAAEDFCVRGAISPAKRAHSEMSTPIQNIGG